MTFYLRDELALVAAEYTYLVYASDITESDDFIFPTETSYVFAAVCGDETFYYPEAAPAVIEFVMDND